MPQMSPLNWLILYLYILLIMMFINVILSYLFLMMNKENNKNLKIIKLNYKWMW